MIFPLTGLGRKRFLTLFLLYPTLDGCLTEMATIPKPSLI